MQLKQMACLVVAAGVVMGLCVRSSYARGLAATDKGFMKDAAQAGHLELQAARLALQRSSNERVADFATMMIQDHEQLAQELAALAKARHVELPATPTLMQRGKLAFLQEAKGEQFDADYANEVALKAHETTIKLFEDYIEKGRDRELMGFVQDALPLLRQHLQHAHVLADSMKPALAQ